jgi:prephenate dehydrogenase
VPLRRLAIVGTGLIGASIGLAAKRAGVERISAYDADPEALAVAAERGAIDATAGSVVEAVEEAELAVVATPVATLGAQVETVLDAADGATVTDVGSTKGRLCARVEDRARYIGGHPVCGSEARGPAHASAELFEGATWFLTPVAETEPERYKELHGFVGSLGAVPVAIDPSAHDRLLALTSHLPHALANVVLNHAGSFRVHGHEPLAAAGGSLRDMTRVAGANPRIWIDIFLDNAEELRSALAEHRRRVAELEQALASSDAGWLARWIGEAGVNRRKLLEEAFADVGELPRVRVHVSDRPGVLSGITQALGAEQINIEDFELQHLSPERGGTLSVLVAGEREARRAAELLEAQGYSVIVSPAFEDS